MWQDRNVLEALSSRFNNNQVNLEGVFSEAANLWTNLPVKCPEDGTISCGEYKTKLPGATSRMLMIRGAARERRRIGIATFVDSDYQKSRAMVFIQIDFEAAAIIDIKSKSQGKEREEEKQRSTRMYYRRVGSQDWVGVEKENQTINVLAEMIELQEIMIGENEDSNCWPCAAKENCLPRSVV